MLLSNTNMKSESSGFRFPRELLYEKYNGYSAETKLLLSLVMSNAEKTDSVVNVASLISEIKPSDLDDIMNSIREAENGVNGDV